MKTTIEEVRVPSSEIGNGIRAYNRAMVELYEQKTLAYINLLEAKLEELTKERDELLSCPVCDGEGGERWIEYDGSDCGVECGRTCDYCGGSGHIPPKDQLKKEIEEAERMSRELSKLQSDVYNMKNGIEEVPF